MQLKSLVNDDTAVSPVIGVILMVAITVILAAVIATFVLGLSDQVSSTAPQATFSFDYDASSSTGTGSSGAVTIVHDGGDSIPASELYVRGSDVADTGQWGGLPTSNTGSNSKVRAGNSAVAGVDSQSFSLRVIYQSNEGGTSATLGKVDGPDA